MSPREAFRTPQGRILFSIALLATVLRTPFAVWGDTWFNLVLGREIATSGLITHNDLTQQGFGAECVDQQWLAHLVVYCLERHCGLVGVLLLSPILASSVFVAGAWSALSRGSTPGRTLVLGLLAYGVLVSQTVTRAQTLVLPFMLAFPVVLSNDVRSPNRKTWWLVPCAAVWANLHGSVLLAPAMGVLLLVGRLIDARRRHETLPWRVVSRDGLLAASLFAAVFASPYAWRLPEYYRSTFANPAFRAYISEWQSPSPARDPAAIVLSVVILVLVVTSLRAMPAFEASLGLVLATGTLMAVRHGTPLALTATALFPRWADAALGRSLRVESDRILESISRVLLPIAFVAFASIPFCAARALRLGFPVAFADRVAAAADGRGFLLASEGQADRLLWFHPALKGRVSHDARIEALSATFIHALAFLYASPDAPRSRELLAGYDLLLVDREDNPKLFESMSRDPRWEDLADDAHSSAFVRRDLPFAPARRGPPP